MLVLTRKSGESIRIGNNIIITVLESPTGQTKIGVKAPLDVPIHREEVYNRIQQENKSALLVHDEMSNMLAKYVRGKS